MENFNFCAVHYERKLLSKKDILLMSNMLYSHHIFVTKFLSGLHNKNPYRVHTYYFSKHLQVFTEPHSIFVPISKALLCSSYFLIPIPFSNDLFLVEQ